ncbi:MAG: flippase-like domain-containing protein [Dehalococcoidia bacterium]|nr:flippase-like domain-containing protein [Dehalococcoidia bacterium]
MRSVPTIASFAVALAVMALMVKGFGINLGETWDAVKSANPYLYVLAIFSYYVAFLLRGWRWQIMIRNIGINTNAGEKVPSIRACTEFIMLGWFGNTLAVARLGDAYRSWLLSHETGIGFSRSFGTIVAERMIDVATVAVLLAISIALFIAGIKSGERSWILVSLGVGLGLVFAALIILLAMVKYGKRVALKLPGRFNEIYKRIHDGTLGSFRRLPLLFSISAMLWIIDSLRLLLVLQAVDAHIEMTAVQALAFILFASLAQSVLTAIPFTPGGLGFVEAGFTGILAPVLSSASLATAITILERSITYASVVVFGGILFISRQIFKRGTSQLAQPSVVKDSS